MPLTIRSIDSYRVAVLLNMFGGAVIGAGGYFGLRLAVQLWGSAMFRFSIREIVLVTIIVALVCGWAIDHYKMDDEVWRLRWELNSRGYWSSPK